MQILIFGNHSFPDLSFELHPSRGFKVMCKNNFVLDYEGLDKTVTWKDLIERTEPSVCGYSEKFMPFPINHRGSAWGRLKTTLLQLTQSKGEHRFLQSYFEASERSLVSNETRSTFDQCNWPALIPQAWVNWIHYEPQDKERAERRKKEPFRVDFMMFSGGRRLVIEVDGTSHFSEILDIEARSGRIKFEPSLVKYTEHLKKDRWLRNQGWEVWRFSDLEILETEELGIKGILAEMVFHELFW
jgi:very-short-patch-repair endonuclease